MKKTSFAMLLLSGALCTFGATAHAAPAALTPTHCASASPHPDGLSVSDVSFNGAFAADCFGVAGGNINSASDLGKLGLSWDTSGFSLIGHSEAGQDGFVDFQGIRFTLSVDTGKEGGWLLTASDMGEPLDLPAQFEFIVGLKASDRFALWLFDDVQIDGRDEGTFRIAFPNKGGNIPDLSHLILFGQTLGAPGIPQGSLPEPSSLALLGISLVALGARRRRASPDTRA